MKLSHDEKMVLRQASNILRKHLGNTPCNTCDIDHNLCDDKTWLSLWESCPLEGYAILIEDYIKVMDASDLIERRFL